MRTFWTNPHQAEVGSTAADVSHQHQLFACDLAFVVQRRSDRFELKLHVGKARLLSGRQQRRLRLGVARGIVVNKKDRPPQHDAPQRVPASSFGQGLQAPQVAGDYIAVANRAAGADVGALVEQAGAEDALHRPHQAAVDTFDIRRQRSAAVKAVGFVLVRRRVGAVENRGWHGRVAGVQLHQSNRGHATVGPRQGHRRVRGTKVDGDEVVVCGCS